MLWAAKISIMPIIERYSSLFITNGNMLIFVLSSGTFWDQKGGREDRLEKKFMSWIRLFQLVMVKETETEKTEATHDQEVSVF